MSVELMSEVPKDLWRRIRFVFTDIDDTLTEEGQLTSSAYQALGELNAAGIGVVPITGRPAGWCDLIARLWPVLGVVGENGAFYFRYDRELKKMERFYADSKSERDAKKARLSLLAIRIIQEVSGAAISADQAYRESDLAIDIAEDVQRLSDSEIQKIVSIFEGEGATAKVSSIHVNGWFGDYNKLSMTKIFARRCLAMDLDVDNTETVFIGDSPNDAPMFEFFEHAVGVANIKNFLGQLRIPPRYVTDGFGGVGFAELASMLVEAIHEGSN